MDLSLLSADQINQLRQLLSNTSPATTTATPLQPAEAVLHTVPDSAAAILPQPSQPSALVPSNQQDQASNSHFGAQVRYYCNFKGMGVINPSF